MATRIKEEFERRYPCSATAYPSKATAEIATALGVNKSWVAKVGKAMGRQKSNMHALSICPCGSKSYARKGLCMECRRVPLACRTCHTIFYRMQGEVLNGLARGHNRHGFYCSAKCRVKRPPIPYQPKLVSRQQAYNNDGGICYLCGLPVSRQRFHLDHVIPLKRGGVHEQGNVRPTHPECNKAKGNQLPEEISRK